MYLFETEPYLTLLDHAKNYFKRYQEALIRREQKKAQHALTETICTYIRLKNILSQLENATSESAIMLHAVRAKIIELRLTDFQLQTEGETEDFINFYNKISRVIEQYEKLSRNFPLNKVYEIYQEKLNTMNITALREELANCAENISDQFVDGAENTEELSDAIKYGWFQNALEWMLKTRSAPNQPLTDLRQLGLLYILDQLYIRTMDLNEKQAYLAQMEKELLPINSNKLLGYQFEMLSYHYSVITYGGKSCYSLADIVEQLHTLYPKLMPEEQTSFHNVMLSVQRGSKEFQSSQITLELERITFDYLSTSECDEHQLKAFLVAFKKILCVTDEQHKDAINDVINNALEKFIVLLNSYTEINLQQNSEIIKSCYAIYDEFMSFTITPHTACDTSRLNEIHEKIQHLEDLSEEIPPTQNLKRKADEELPPNKRIKTAGSSAHGLFKTTVFNSCAMHGEEYWLTKGS